MLAGHVALVIGGLGSIGSSIGDALRKNGAEVYLTTHKKECQYDNVLYLDVTDLNSIEAVNAKVKYIPNILVTCAASPPAIDKAEDLDVSIWKSVIDVDLTGVYLCCKVFGKNMIENKYGRIINLASFHTKGTYPYRVAYNAAKAGVVGVTQALAVEWGCYGITVNCVSPGPVKTPRTNYFLNKDPDSKDGMVRRTPNGRLAEREDVSDLISFLASPNSRHINGQNIVVDGGWSKNFWWGDVSIPR